MTRDLFRRYVWLVETVKKGKKLTFDEISRRWDESRFNTNRSKLALRTFHNHREAIEQLFGIKILCDRSDHHYYIPEDTTQSTNLKLWMLQSLAFDHLPKTEGCEVENRMVFDEVPGHMFGLISMIEAMKGNNLLCFDYAYPDSKGSHSLVVAPYCIRFKDNTWFLLGKNVNDDKLEAFRLPLISNIRVIEETFRFPADFSPEKYFRQFIGESVADGAPTETIEIKAVGNARHKLRALPLHESQKEVESNPRYSIFTLEAVPTVDLIENLLIMQCEAEVLQPESLRNNIKDRLHKMIEIYR